jgi:hypothetical protein
MIDEADLDGDGVINYEEFYNLMRWENAQNCKNNSLRIYKICNSKLTVRQKWLSVWACGHSSKLSSSCQRKKSEQNSAFLFLPFSFIFWLSTLGFQTLYFSFQLKSFISIFNIKYRSEFEL